MKMYIKGALIFTGGVVTGMVISGATVLNFATKHKEIPKALGKIIANKLVGPRWSVDFDTRGDAESFAQSVCDVIDEYGFISVAEAYEIAGLAPMYKDHYYKLTDTKHVRVMRKGDVYAVMFTEPIAPIKKGEK